MNPSHKSALTQLAEAAGLVLLYHSLAPEVPEALRGNIHNVTPDQLRNHIEDLAPYFRFVSLHEFTAAKDKSGLCAVTFDDGYANVLENAPGILQSHQIQATMFVNTRVVQGSWNWRDKVRTVIAMDLVEEFYKDSGIPPGEKRFYRHSKSPNVNSETIDRLLNQFLEERKITNEDVQGLFPYARNELFSNSQNLSLGNHGRNHYVLSSLSHEQQVREIQGGRSDLEAMFGDDVSPCFSIPFGGTTDVNEQTWKALASAGYDCALMSRQSLQPAIAEMYSSTSKIQILERFMPRTDNIVREISEAVEPKPAF